MYLLPLLVIHTYIVASVVKYLVELRLNFVWVWAPTSPYSTDEQRVFDHFVSYIMTEGMW
jgi:hypothetical protein